MGIIGKLADAAAIQELIDYLGDRVVKKLTASSKTHTGPITITGGTNKFTISSEDSSGNTVTSDISVTPSITNNVTGSGTSGYLAKFNGTNTVTSGPQLGSNTTTFLRNDGQWATPSSEDTDTTYTFESGTACFYVTPKGGTKQTITITPSAMTVTGTGTKDSIAMFNGDHTITNSPASFGSSTTTYLRNDGSWATPPNTNTTYSFTQGTNCFYVTPSNGTQFAVSVIPSISNNVTGSGASGRLAAWTSTNVIGSGIATNRIIRIDTDAVTDTECGGNMLMIYDDDYNYCVAVVSLSFSYTYSTGALSLTATCNAGSSFTGSKTVAMGTVIPDRISSNGTYSTSSGYTFQVYSGGARLYNASGTIVWSTAGTGMLTSLNGFTGARTISAAPSITVGRTYYYDLASFTVTTTVTSKTLNSALTNYLFYDFVLYVSSCYVYHNVIPYYTLNSLGTGTSYYHTIQANAGKLIYIQRTGTTTLNVWKDSSFTETVTMRVYGFNPTATGSTELVIE